MATSEQLESTNEELILSFLAEGEDDFTSGEALSDKLGLSRAAVWKVVESLRGQGYGIQAVPARGYRLVAVPDRLSGLELGPLLSTRELGRKVEHHASVGSTNEVAFRLAQEGAGNGLVVVAEQQTAGRGRRGRQWFAEPGGALTLSVVLRPDLPPQRAPELTLVAAVALAEVLREAEVPAQIKWPNDLLVAGKKVAGILTELSAEADRVHFVVLGVGVNLNTQAFPDDLRAVATSAALVRGQPVPRALFTAAFLASLERWLDRHQDEGFEPIRAHCRDWSCTVGQQVLVRSEKLELRGLAEDLADDGALLLRTPDGTVHRVVAGDVEQLRTAK